MTDTQTKEVTLTFSRDDGETAEVEVSVEYSRVGIGFCGFGPFVDQVTEYYLPADFKKEDHGDWRSELKDQLHRDHGFNTDEIK